MTAMAVINMVNVNQLIDMGDMEVIVYFNNGVESTNIAKYLLAVGEGSMAVNSWLRELASKEKEELDD